jgi:cbb3-type cytochrome oxidase maturation protein
MDILFLLIPLSVLTVMALLALFAWALHKGQFDNVEREGERILWDDGTPPPSTTATQVAAVPKP